MRRLSQYFDSPRRPDDMRFDLNARVEVWVSGDEIKEHDGYSDALALPSEEAKIARLRELAADVARNKINAVRGVEITVDSISNTDVNIDRVDWYSLIHKADAQTE